ncbi:thrombospondin-2-like [Hydra vulgaris]|uniref:Thrombospondin-2-like n=1 Tax=Hydra vulgaris TaxID=6087 RepID=A0ABM4CMV2_HYDVU
MSSITSLCKLTYKTESLKPTPSLQNLNFASTTQTLVAINFSSFSIKSSATLTSTQFATIISSTMVFNKTKATNISPSLTNISPSLPYSDDSRAQALSTIGMSGVKIEEWPMWGECSATCGEGSKTSYFMGSAKIPLKRIESCIEMDCPVDGMWGSWIKSGNCTNPCSNERVTYDRMCDSPSPNYNSLDCMGIKSYTEDCQNNIICPVFGNWLEWSNWSLCNQPCGGDGVVSRFRTCFNPKKSGLVFCNGINAETRACFFKNCETVDLNLFVNLSDVEYLDQYPYLISQQSFDLKEKIKNAISRLYKNSKRNVTISIVIHSIKSDNP